MLSHRSILKYRLPHILRSLSSNSSPDACSPIDPSFLLRLSTVLYQQQDAPDSKLHAHLQKLQFSPSQELFLQVCNQFPFCWKPVHRFLLYSRHTHNFTHSPTTANKALSVFAKSCNTQLLWGFLHEIAGTHLFTPRSLVIAATYLAEAREIKKCVELFNLDPSFLCVNNVNRVIEALCDGRLVDVAKKVVSKLRSLVPLNETTYRFLIIGFCRVGDLVEASRIWNKIVDEGLVPDVESYEEVVVTLFKSNRFQDAMKLFKLMRNMQYCNLGLDSYRAIITWLCKEGRVPYAFMLFADMVKRGITADNPTFGALVYGLLVKRRVREGYKFFEGIGDPDISVYHGLIKGLLRLKRAGEATEVVRVMVRRGCEPIMHTYIMLLQGHLGKRGRKGRDPLVNFENIFVGGLVKVGKTLEATKYVERMMGGAMEVPRFDYNRFLHCFSNEEGVVMFEEVGQKFREVGLVDLSDIFLMYGERMATRDRRRRAKVCCLEALL